jgi:hypothetical protein
LRSVGDPDKAPIPQGFELLIDPLPCLSDHGSQILLRDLHRDPDPAFLTDTEGVPEFEDLLRESGGDVEEVPARQKQVDIEDPARKHLQDLLYDIEKYR